MADAPATAEEPDTADAKAAPAPSVESRLGALEAGQARLESQVGHTRALVQALLVHLKVPQETVDAELKSLGVSTEEKKSAPPAAEAAAPAETKAADGVEKFTYSYETFTKVSAMEKSLEPLYQIPKRISDMEQSNKVLMQRFDNMLDDLGDVGSMSKNIERVSDQMKTVDNTMNIVHQSMNQVHEKVYNISDDVTGFEVKRVADDDRNNRALCVLTGRSKGGTPEDVRKYPRVNMVPEEPDPEPVVKDKETKAKEEEAKKKAESKEAQEAIKKAESAQAEDFETDEEDKKALELILAGSL